MVASRRAQLGKEVSAVGADGGEKAGRRAGAPGEAVGRAPRTWSSTFGCEGLLTAILRVGPTEPADAACGLFAKQELPEVALGRRRGPSPPCVWENRHQ